MKTNEQIRLDEIERCKSYSNRQIRANILIYNFFQFLFSRKFMFLFYAAPIVVISCYLTFPIEIKILSGIISHFILFMLIDPFVGSFLQIDYTVKEISILIDVNKQILKQRLHKN